MPQPRPAAIRTSTWRYGNNVFYQVSNETFGVFEFDPGAQPFKDLQSFQQALVKDKALDAGLGVTTDKQPLRDPANHDMRPAAGSAAIDQGVKFFVPWMLYAPVAEWNFYHAGNDVAQIPDEHWCSLDYAAGRGGIDIPTYPLTAVSATEDSYVQGDLEDWIHGALKLNGKDQYCHAVAGDHRQAGHSAQHERQRRAHGPA